MNLDQQIACIRRELSLRQNVYRKRVVDGKMRAAEADHELAAMQAVHDTVMAVKRLRATMVEHFPLDRFKCSCGWEAQSTLEAGARAAQWAGHVFERSKAAEEQAANG